MEIERAKVFLASVGFTQLAGITFEFDLGLGGLRGVALLLDGREVRFWLPEDPSHQGAVINVVSRTSV